VQLIIAEIENGDGLTPTRFLSSVALVEQRRIAAIGTNSNRRGKAIGAGEVAGDGERKRLAGWKIDSARAVGGACDNEHDKKCGQCEDGNNGDLFHETVAS